MKKIASLRGLVKKIKQARIFLSVKKIRIYYAIFGEEIIIS